MQTIDARGLSCPEPVVLTRNAMASKEDAYEVLVDAAAARENVMRDAQNQGYRVSVAEKDGEFTLSTTKEIRPRVRRRGLPATNARICFLGGSLELHRDLLFSLWGDQVPATVPVARGRGGAHARPARYLEQLRYLREVRFLAPDP